MKNIYIKESHNELGAQILKEWERDKQGVLEKWVKERQQLSSLISRDSKLGLLGDEEE